MSFYLKIFVLMLLLHSCQSNLSVRQPIDTSRDQTGKTSFCTEQTSPSPQCPSNNTDDNGDDDNSDDDNNDNGSDSGNDDPCRKDCDDICSGWGKVTNFSSYEGDVSTCSDNSYTLTRTGTRSRTCPEITCDGAKKECLTTEDITESKEKECRCSTVRDGQECSMVSTCLQRAPCQDSRQKCQVYGTPCMKWGEKEVCTDTDDSEVTCYDR